MCDCHSILECCVMFSGVKLSMGSFVLLLLRAQLIFSSSRSTVKATKSITVSVQLTIIFSKQLVMCFPVGVT